jgi:tetratricopeptide (TPR) repeat protein
MALQLAEFRMPRWYTEALSTWLEDDQRVEADRMMIEYIARGKLKGLGEMNEYFRSNPLMAYVHGRYVIAYLEKNFGFEAIVKALKLFAQGKKQNDVLPAVTGKTLKELDEGQAAFVKDVFSKVKMRPAADPASLVQLELAAKKEDATAQDIANLAAAKLALRQMAAAEELARKALEKDARCVDAINILGHAAYERRDYEGARQQFLKSTGIDPDRSFAAWQRLGLIYKKEGKTTKAIEAFEAARKVYPRYAGPENPHHELPALYADLEPPQLDKALAVWRDAVKNDPDDAEAAQKGLLLATTMKDYKAAAEFAQAYVEVDPYKPEVHCLFGQACRELKDFARAAREYQVATALNDKDVESWIGLARAHQALGQREAALTAVQKALDVDGMCPAAKALRDELR